MTPGQRQALEAFGSRLPRGARILYAPARGAESREESRTPEWFRAQGFEIEELDPAKDLRFLSVKRESQGAFDAVWAGRALTAFSIEEAQRVVASFFQALRPRNGHLFAIHGFDGTAFASMLRQNGFQLLLEGKRDTETAVIAQRI